MACRSAGLPSALSQVCATHAESCAPDFVFYPTRASPLANSSRPIWRFFRALGQVSSCGRDITGKAQSLGGTSKLYVPLRSCCTSTPSIAAKSHSSLAPQLAMTRLWSRIQQVYRAAEESGALFKIQTKPLSLRDAKLELDFRLQVSDALKEKPKASSQKNSGPDSKPADVFAVRDEALSVDEQLSPTHVLRLNKFNVVPYHSLVITREFEPQTARLTEADWEATRRAVEAYPEGALAYFNGGEDSGSSQPRKHVQVLPLAIDGEATAPLPLNGICRAESQRQPLLEAVELRKLPFQSLAATLPPSVDARGLHRAYENLMAARPAATSSAHYNVLWAENCMLLVPRKQDSSGPVGCNALVFAGTLLVRHTPELDHIRETGPLGILEDVCFPWEDSEE